MSYYYYSMLSNSSKSAQNTGRSFAKGLILGVVFLMAFTFFSANSPANHAYAQEDSSAAGELDTEGFNKRLGGDTGVANEESASGENCAGVKIAFSVDCRDDFSNPILAYLVAILRFLTYGIGIVVILMIIIGGIQYASAGGNAQSVTAAKMRIMNAVIALILYIFAFAILNFVVPGGLIG